MFSVSISLYLCFVLLYITKIYQNSNRILYKIRTQIKTTVLKVVTKIAYLWFSATYKIFFRHDMHIYFFRNFIYIYTHTHTRHVKQLASRQLLYGPRSTWNLSIFNLIDRTCMLKMIFHEVNYTSYGLREGNHPKDVYWNILKCYTRQQFYFK